MSEDDVQLDRRFLHLKGGEENELSRDLPLFELRDLVPWETVLGERCAVILGEAGTGKTTEFRLRCKVLADAGAPAFFLAVEALAAEPVQSLLGPEEEERFSRWVTGETTGYFFLDAVDEARLRNKSLGSALRSLNRELRARPGRSRVLISCRVSDWRAERDRREIHDVLLRGEPAQEVKVFALAPLVESQVVVLAKRYRVGDVESFMHEARRAGAHSYLERPGDVASLVVFWREHGTIGNYSQLLESNVDRKLRESNPERKPSLTPARAKIAATALAGLATLQRKGAFVLPDGELDSDRATTSLDPHEVLPDMTSGEIVDLLTLPLFDEATYGRVRIHHRSVSEYLTARWLLDLMQQGLELAAVESLLFQETPSGPAVPPELVQPAAWLAGENPSIRARVMEVAPLVLLEGGDPNSLPAETRREVLYRLSDQYEGRERLFKSFDRIALRRLATSSLSETVNELLAERTRPAELLNTLLQIVVEGHLEGCAAAVVGIAADRARSAIVRAHALDAVGVVGAATDKQAVSKLLLSEQDIDPEVLGPAIEVLFPTFLDVTGVLESLQRSATPPPNKTSALARVLGGRVYEKTPAADQGRLLSGILAFVQDADRAQARRWLLAPFARMVVAHVSAHNDRVGSQALAFLDELARGLTLETRHDLYRVSEELSALLRDRADLRRFLFWERAALRPPHGRGRPSRYLEPPQGRTSLWRVSSDDLDWLERDALSREHVADRLLAFDTFLSVQVPDGRVEELRARTAHLVASDPALRKRFERRASRSSYTHPDEARWQREQQVSKNRDELKRVAEVAWLRDHLDDMQSGRAQAALIALLHRSLTSDEYDIEVLVSELSEQFDGEIAQAVVEGWRHSWRTVECPLPHEQEERNVVSNTAMLGLAGLAADLRHGLDLASLSVDAATQAARLATHAMNHFPPWVVELVRYHAPSVETVFGACVRADYSASRHHDVLGMLPYAPEPIRNTCGPILEQEVRDGDPRDTGVLEQVIEVLLSSPPRRAVIATLAAERCANSAHEPPRFALWWVAWLASDPESAVDSLSTHVGADAVRAGDLVLAVCKRVCAWLEPHQQTGFGLPEKPRTVTSLLSIVLAYIRPSDDARRVGAYTPGARDDAERLRSLLIERLAAIPGHASVDGLTQLANDPRWSEWRDWFLSLAERRRDDDLTVASNDVAAKLVKLYHSHGLAAPAHLADVGLRTASVTTEREQLDTESKLPMQKHTILFLAANPSQTDARALDREARAIQVELERSGFRDSFEFVTRWAVEPLDLLRELRKLKPTVVHFSGLGGQRLGYESTPGPVPSRDDVVVGAAGERDSRTHGLFFQDSDGSARFVSTEAIRDAFGATGDSVKVVVLSACYSELQAEALLEHVDCVIGMSDTLSDDAARSFAIGFYGGLGERESVAAAFQQGRAAIGLEGLSDAARPQMNVRAGVDAARIVLAAALRRASEIVAGPQGGPQPSSAKLVSAPPNVDIGILTIRDDEFRAVLRAFPSKAGTYKGPRTSREYTIRHADAGHGARYTVAILCQIEQGNGEAQNAARDLIEDFAPGLILVVGIAGGLPSADVKLGDVILSLRIHDFTLEARQFDADPTYSTTGGPIAKSLAATIANLPGREDELGTWNTELPPQPLVAWTAGQTYGPPEWQNKVRNALEYHYRADSAPRMPIYVAGPIASSDRLVKDPEILIPLLQTARKVLAIEMESGGVYRAAQDRCSMLAIRGISDIVGLKRAEDWTTFACASAAAFARAFLRIRPVPVDVAHR